MEIVTENNVRV